MKIINATRRVRSIHGIGLLTSVFIIVISSATLLQGCKKQDNKSPQAIDLKLIAGNFGSPIEVVPAPDNSNRLFVVDQVGKVWIIDNNNQKIATPFIDVSSKIVSLMPGYDERGLLGLAFHPNFKSNGKFYLYYTAPPHAGGPTVESGNTGLPMTWDNLSRISEFTVSGNPNEANMSSEKVILEIDQPQFNHEGGTIAFGPDGYLYISIGDGGNKDDIGPGHVADWYKVNDGGNGQDVEKNLLGNILRIDVNNSSGDMPYSIPSDNPFAGKPGKDEVYAYGFRNPYRFSFDMGGSHQLFAGDAGQSLYEEINVVTKGGNYGWNVKEGRHCFNTDNDLVERNSCLMVDSAGNPLIDPVIELPNHDNPNGGIATAVVGGNVYRGHSIPSLQGKYIFGILSSGGSEADGKLLMAQPTGQSMWSFSSLKLKSFPDNLGQYLKGFGQDHDGEIYVTTSDNIGPSGNTGKVYKLVGVK